MYLLISTCGPVVCHVYAPLVCHMWATCWPDNDHMCVTRGPALQNACGPHVCLKWELFQLPHVGLVWPTCGMFAGKLHESRIDIEVHVPLKLFAASVDSPSQWSTSQRVGRVEVLARNMCDAERVPHEGHPETLYAYRKFVE